MDNVLVPFLTAEDDGQRQHQLDELLIFRAGPLIRNVLLRRLDFHVSAHGVNENNQDAEDLYQEAMSRVVQGLNHLHSTTDTDIENFELYVSRLASNICIDFLRARSPARTRLKYSLRDLLKRHKGFGSWEREGERLCGLLAWQNTGKSPFSDQVVQDFEGNLDSFESLYFADRDIRLAPLSHIITELFDWMGGPVEIDLLVRMIAYLLDIKDQQIGSLDDPAARRRHSYFAADIQSAEAHLEANELLTRLWRVVIRLPAEQRDAFAFGFEDETGQDLFSVLIAAEIVNWNELAQGMGRSIEDVVRLRLRMPMDGAAVADELRTSSENVYKWRFRAIRRLKTELKR
jgi:RNA polymerase sigma factor (sigma-70 family)